MEESTAAAAAAVHGEEAAVVDDVGVGSTPVEQSKKSSRPKTPPSHDILGSIARLKAEQLRLREEKRVIAKQLKNEEKRRTRLKKRARLLSDGDLVALLKMRSDGESASAASDRASAAASSS